MWFCFIKVIDLFLKKKVVRVIYIKFLYYLKDLWVFRNIIGFVSREYFFL